MQTLSIVAERLEKLSGDAQGLAQNLQLLADQAKGAGQAFAAEAGAASGHAAGVLDPGIVGLSVFVLACFVGYYVVWKVTPALHSPLMAVTNAVSSVIIVGAMIAAGPADFNFAKIMGFLAVILASVNIFGGFIVTQRMLSMFKKKK